MMLNTDPGVEGQTVDDLMGKCACCSCRVFVFCVLLACTYMQHMDSRCLQKLKEGIRLSGNGVLGSCEPLSLCRELNLGPL